MMAALAIDLEGVGKTYPHFTLDDIDLKLPVGSIMGFIGANGAGKSTTLRIIMGLIEQDRGRVEVLGHPLPKECVAAKRDIGFASEDLRLYGGASLAWHMGFIASIFPSWDKTYAKELLRRFDLKPVQNIKGLSHGQRVKAALLLILARRPRLLVLDEPTIGLDPVARQEVLAELTAVLADDQRSILFSSHNTLDVEQISDQITFIDRGRIIESRDKESFLDGWRRLRIEMPEGAALPRVPGVVSVNGTGRLLVVTTASFDSALPAALSAAGAAVRSVEPMTLEEIFVANVHARREGVAA
jgi:ABC-2 type transport system ATP-binding protein